MLVHEKYVRENEWGGVAMSLSVISTHTQADLRQLCVCRFLFSATGCIRSESVLHITTGLTFASALSAVLECIMVTCSVLLAFAKLACKRASSAARPFLGCLS